MMAHEWSRILVESFVRGGLILAVAALTVVLLRRRSGAMLHAVWLAGIAGVLIAPLAGAWLPRMSVPVLPSSVSPSVMERSGANVITTAPLATDHAAAPAPIKAGRTRPSTDIILGWVWMTGVLVMMLRIVRAHRRITKLVRGSELIRDPHMVAAFQSALATSGAPSLTSCRVSTQIEVPLACGFLRPVVLLPCDAAQWPDAVRDSVLAHELAHLNRRDPLLLAFAHGVRALHWFNPLVWMAVREMRAESEHACDDAVLRSGALPSHYAQTLFSFAGKRSAEPALAFWRRGSLERRINGILAARRDRRVLGRGEMTAVVTLGFVMIIMLGVIQPVAVNANKKATKAPKAVGQGEWYESWWKEASTTKPSAVDFFNASDAPVLIESASARIVPLGSGVSGIAMPTLALKNLKHDQEVVALLLAVDLPTTRDRSWIDVAIDPAGSAKLTLPTHEWSANVPDSDVEQLLVHVEGVKFANGKQWNAVTTRAHEDANAPQAARHITIWPGATAKPGETTVEAPAVEVYTPAAKSGETTTEAPDVVVDTPTAKIVFKSGDDEPEANKAGDTSKWLRADVRNPEDAPVVIVEARTDPDVHFEGGDPVTRLPQVVIENRSSRRVTSVRIRYKADPTCHAVSGRDVDIPPHGRVTLYSGSEVTGRPEAMGVQLLGVRFKGGKIWGTLDSTIDARDQWVYPLSPEGR